MDYSKDTFHGVYGVTSLKVDGSVATGNPTMFRVKNYMTDATIDITQVKFLLNANGALEFDGFGDGSALTRGVQLVTEIANGVLRRSGFNIKTNGQLSGVSDHLINFEKASGEFGTLGKKYLGPSPFLGAVVRLVKARGDSLEMWVQDNLEYLQTLYAGVESSAIIE